MLIRTLLRKTLHVKRHRISKVIQTADGIEVYLDSHRRRRLFCGRCGTSAKERGRLNPRRWKHVPLWGFPVTLIYSFTGTSNVPQMWQGLRRRDPLVTGKMPVKQRIDFPVKFDGQTAGLGCRGQNVPCQLEYGSIGC